MRLSIPLAVVAAVCAAATAAHAAASPECTVRVLHSVTDDLGNHWTPGTLLPVTIFRSSKEGGAFCASGGSCIPKTIAGSAAVTLTNCRVGASLGNGDFRLEPDPALAGPAVARAMRKRDTVISKLGSLGFSNASAATLADTYLSAPHSQTGRLVSQALAGSTTAVMALKRNSP